ncbi:MAG: glycosyltransferase family 2 protein [Armatimonadetes bacterium]|nr:glycosyltransferase family 2 protein [Armatimonadota bacterium]
MLSSAANPRVSVAIVSWNTRVALRECLTALFASTGVALEVFVVDNASGDLSAEMVTREFPQVFPITNATNVGFARAANQALRRMTGDYWVLLNPDTQVAPDALAILARFLADHPDTGACGPRLLHTDGRLQPNGGRFPSLLALFLTAARLRHLNLAAYDRCFRWGREEFTITVPVDQVSGACLMVPRAVAKRVGLLDERFFLYYEEVDWCRRIADAGLWVYYVAEAKVRHRWGESTRQIGFTALRHLFESEYLYFRKHAPRWQRPLAWLLTRLEIAQYAAADWWRRRVKSTGGPA